MNVTKVDTSKSIMTKENMLKAGLIFGVIFISIVGLVMYDNFTISRGKQIIKGHQGASEKFNNLSSSEQSAIARQIYNVSHNDVQKYRLLGAIASGDETQIFETISKIKQEQSERSEQQELIQLQKEALALKKAKYITDSK